MGHEDRLGRGRGARVWFVLLPQGIRRGCPVPNFRDPGQGSSQGQLGEPWALIVLDLG